MHTSGGARAQDDQRQHAETIQPRPAAAEMHDSTYRRCTPARHARDLHVVMGPAAPGTAVRFRVRIDGQPPGAAHGSDVDEKGEGTLTEQRLHQLIRQQTPIADREFDIEFFGPGVEVYAFTFG